MFLVYLLLFVLLIISAFVVITRSREILQTYSNTLERVSGKMGLLLKIRKNSEQVKSAIVGYVMHSDPKVGWKEEKSVYANIGANKNYWSLYKAMLESREEAVLFDSIIKYEQRQSDIWAEVIKIKQSKKANLNDSAFHALFLNPAYIRYQFYISALSDFIVNNIHTDNKRIENLVFDARKKIIFFTFFSFCLLLLLGALIWKTIGSLQDDNDLLQLQDNQIRQQKLLFEGILSAAPDGIIGIDQGGKIVLFNKEACTMFGYKIEEIIGESPERIISFKFDETPSKNIAEYFAGLTESTLDHREKGLYAFGKGNVSFPVDIRLGNIQTDKGIYFILVVRDVTKRKISEAELMEKNSILKNLTAYQQNIMEEERKSLAREVHDELGQLASAIKVDIDWFGIRLGDADERSKKKLSHAIKTIEVLISTIRKIASGLRPSVLDDFGLNAALQWHCTEFENLNGIPCIFRPGFIDSDLPMKIKTELFRIAQEATTNVMRHAKAGKIVINATEDEKNLYLTIRDNGVGFDVEQNKNTLGLIGLHERANAINGKLKIESSAGKGTTVSIALPREFKP